MSFDLPKLYAITDTRLSGLSHAAQVTRLAAGGAKLIQLREKHLSSRAFYEGACDALRVARELGVKLIVNDRVDIALTLGADGVHLGQTDLPTEDARRLLGPNAIIGLSVHNEEQAESAMHSSADYLAAGPVFATKSKDNPDPVLGINGLLAIRKTIGTIPLVAIGGIDHRNALDVLHAGADAIASISAVLANPIGIEAATLALIQLRNTKTSEN
jgi:thiamine-phosphate pyrophosphorylase